ncbi:MAG: hypothetical protein ACLFR1_07815 [Spirochaetia bacterium]
MIIQKLTPILVIALVLVTPVFSETRYYESNSLGQPLRAIPRIRLNEFEYTVEIETSDAEAQRTITLYESGVITKTWIQTLDEDSVLAEEEYEGELVSIREYGPEGQLLQEENYEQDELSYTLLYSYEDGVRNSAVYTDSEGEIIYREEYAYTPSGQILQVLRTYQDGTTRRSRYSYAGASLLSEWQQEDSSAFLKRYNSDGTIRSITSYVENEIRSVERFYYEEHTLVSSYYQDRETEQEIERLYDSNEQIIREVINTSPECIIEYEYSDDLLIRKTQVCGNTREEWIYEYDSEDELSQESYVLNGELQSVTHITGESTYYEEIFREEEAFLRVYYENDVRVKEEVIRNGEVVRERTYQ